jgi:hypothetical protein
MPRERKEPKPKKVKYELIPEGKGSNTPEPWLLLRQLVSEHHHHLAEASFALAWEKGVKKDVDGLVVLGRCGKASDLSRELVDYDLIILLNAEAWSRLEPSQRRALMDHELCHAQVATRKDGEPRRDERDRLVYRIRHHDIEEFREIVERHGLYKADLEKFVKAAQAKDQPRLFPAEAADAGEEAFKDEVAAFFDAAGLKVQRDVKITIPDKQTG